jgi:hypothetical protein
MTVQAFNRNDTIYNIGVRKVKIDENLPLLDNTISYI